MKYDRSLIVEIKGIIWRIESGLVTFEMNGNKLILNDTASLVWRTFDGITPISQIVNSFYEEYKENNSRDYIEEIVDSCIEQLENEGLIILKESDEFGGWFNYD